jgi:hypothetical protein
MAFKSEWISGSAKSAFSASALPFLGTVTVSE